MFHVFIDSKVNEGLANSFIECFMDNCQCVTDKTNPDVIIEIIHSIDNRNYLFTKGDILSTFTEELASEPISLSIINTLPEYVDETILAKSDVLKCPYIVLLGSKNKTNTNAMVEFICFCVLKYFHIDSLLEPVSFRELDDLFNMEKVIEKNFKVITDSEGNKSYSKIKDRATVNAMTVERSAGSEVFYVRRRFTDSGSEKLMTGNLQKAVTECDKHTGYHVYNEDGKPIYESKKDKTVINSNRSIMLPNETAIIRSGNGIRLKSQSGEFIMINDGEQVQISKRIGDGIEILVSRNGKQYMTVVNSDVLANF